MPTKKTKTKRRKKLKEIKNKKLYGVNGWLAIILSIFILSAINSLILLIQRIINIISNQVKWGVYVSVFILIIYCFFIFYSIYLIIKKRKKAIKTSIITLYTGALFILWYYIIGVIIFYEGRYRLERLTSEIINVLINLILVIIIYSYFKKSKRVKNTLTK